MTGPRRTIYRHVRTFVYARDGHACIFCGHTTNLHMDHVTPHSQGGRDSSDNLRPLCGPCNLRRGVQSTDDDPHTRPPVALTCETCNPDEGGEHLGYCYQCQALSYVAESQIDRCPDPRRCDCLYTPRARRILAEQGITLERPKWERKRRRRRASH